MKFHVIVYEEREGGFSAEVPALPGCFTQGDTMEELMANVHEAIEGYLEAREQIAGCAAAERIPEERAAP